MLITSDMVAKFTLLMSHYTGLLITFVTRCMMMVPDAIFIVKFNLGARCYLSVSEAIFIVKFNTRPKKKYDNFTEVPITSDRVARLPLLMSH